VDEELRLSEAYGAVAGSAVRRVVAAEASSPEWERAEEIAELVAERVAAMLGIRQATRS
jgi:hypothetical protein